jgi:hypothetical protein
VCESKGDERVESRDQDEVRAHHRLAALPFTSGGAAVLDLLSLAALCLGFWRGRSAGRTEIKLAAWRGQGVRVCARIGEEIGSATSVMSCSSRSLRGR